MNVMSLSLTVCSAASRVAVGLLGVAVARVAVALFRVAAERVGARATRPGIEHT
jgi:hypothetical protein